MDTEQEIPEVFPAEVTLEDLKQSLDMIGKQLNWLCENLAELFKFVEAFSKSGGGFRGLMSAMKNGGPDLNAIQADSEVIK